MQRPLAYCCYFILAVVYVLALDVAKPRVVGGEVTTNPELGGYLIALRYTNQFVCGGTLLQDRIVLTAAHCFMGKRKLKHWTVDGGISKLSEIGVRRQIKAILQPRGFKKKSFNKDVAVILLNEPMVGTNISTLSLCTTSLAPDTLVRVSGWGMTVANSFAPLELLRTVDVPVLEKTKCRKSFVSKIFISDSMLCAALLGQKDACTFDSGGPLVHGNEVCGIVSFGIGCASEKYAGVYTDVKYMLPFINKSIEKLLSTK